MRIFRLVTLTLFAATVATAQTPPRTQTVRDAIEAQYSRLAAAIRSNDVARILAVQDTGFSSDNLSRGRFDYATMEAYTRRMTSAIDSVIHIRNVIRTFQQRGDTAIVDVCQEFSRMQRIGDARPHLVQTSVLQRETWIRRDTTWKRRLVDDEHGMRWFVDGVRVDPSKPYNASAPPYAPDVDPPTGCGVR